MKSTIPFLAGIIGSISVFQQAYKIYVTQKTRDISLWSYIFLFISALLWVIYGLLIKDYDLLIGSTIIIPPTLYIIFKKTCSTDLV
jgi:uncharacterized protein with PQ loop repeat